MAMKKHGEVKWLATQVRSSLLLHVGSLFCIFAASLLVLLDPLIVKWIIDDLLTQRKTKWLLIAAGAFLLAYAGRFFFDGMGTLLSFQATQRTVFKMRLSLLRRLQQLPAEYHENKPVGDNLHRLQQEVDQVGQLGGEAIPALLRLLTLTPLTLMTMFALNSRLTCIVLPFIPAFVLVRQYFRQRLRRCAGEAQEQSGKVSSFLQEHLSAIVQIQLLSRELSEARRFVRLSGNAIRSHIKRKKMELAFLWSSAFIVFTGVAGILGYGGYQVVIGDLSVGGLVAFYSYTLNLFGPFYGIVDVYSKLCRAGASLRRILEIMEVETTLKDRSGARTLARSTPAEIKLKDVSFQYKSGSPALKQVNLLVGPGEKVALVGGSGSGKSTIAKLVSRLYDVGSGAVLVDGEDIRNIRLKSLRSIVGMAPQEPLLFDATLRENLLHGNPGASEKEMEEALEIAQIRFLLRRLPGGWDEPLGPRGGKLSGGERQRVALARTLLQNPRILVLDEPTSALDEATENRLLSELDGYVRGRTLIIITHRPIAMLWADRIVRLDQGEIVENGYPGQASAQNRLLFNAPSGIY
jgi:ATP-binding cassette, subfamily B, bacterial MsbA